MNRPVLLSCDNVRKAYGPQLLFESLSLALRDGDRLGVVGPNGSGKSTLLRVLAGLVEPDAGSRAVRRLLRIGYVEQDPKFAGDARTAADVLDAALAGDGVDAVERAGRVAVALGRAGFDDAGVAVATLSGGWRKRLAIARELVREPDLLLLDEPTNHLDLEGILWLEQLLLRDVPSSVVVSHDRYLLEHVTNRVIEINRAYALGLFEADGRYSVFLERREQALAGQASHRESLAATVRREIEWLHRGPKARTTKAQARIKQAERLIGELEDLDTRAVVRSAEIEFTASERRTKHLLVARGLAKAYEGNPLIDGLDVVLGPGRRLGIIGPNGSGKTTLLKILAGQVNPDRGTIERAHGLRLVYFQQDRAALDPAATLRRSLAPDGDGVLFRGREIHVAGWAQRFLFRADQLDTEVARLSGGEQARILVARLMLQPADVLVLDEPTNDLDIPTLDVLEENLADFPGALVLVTHDRLLLERVTTQVLALDGRGGATYFADYAQWETQRVATRPAVAPGAAITAREARPERAPAGPRRLSYLDQREWDGMEERILAAEERLALADAAVSDPGVASDPAALESRLREQVAAREAVEQLYARWAELEAKYKS